MPGEVRPLLRDTVGHLHDPLAIQPRHPLGGPVEWRARGNRAEVFFDERLRLGRVEVAGNDDRQVIGRVVRAEELTHVVECRGRQVFVFADDVVRIRVAMRVEVLRHQLEPAAVGRVLEPLPAFVLHHLALVVELFGGQRLRERPQPVALDPQQVLEVSRRNGGEIVGPVLVGGAIDAPLTEIGACRFGIAEILFARVLRALEHHVLEEVGKAAPPGALVLRADMKPLVHVYDRELAIHMKDHLEPVRQDVFLECNLWNSSPGRGGGAGGFLGSEGNGSRSRCEKKKTQPFHEKLLVQS